MAYLYVCVCVSTCVYCSGMNLTFVYQYRRETNGYIHIVPKCEYVCKQDHLCLNFYMKCSVRLMASTIIYLHKIYINDGFDPATVFTLIRLYAYEVFCERIHSVEKNSNPNEQKCGKLPHTQSQNVVFY